MATSTDIAWYITATVTYVDGSWLPAEIRHDFSGDSVIGPDISLYPEINALLVSLGFTVLDPVVDPNVSNIVYRFSVIETDSGADGGVTVLGSTDSVPIITDNQAAVATALITDDHFVTTLLTPTLPPTDLAFDFDARFGNSLTKESSGSISEWDDQVNSIKLTVPGGATKPTYLASGLGQRHAVTFDGVSNSLATDFGSFNVAAFTLYTVLQNPGATPGLMMSLLVDANNGFNFYINDLGRLVAKSLIASVESTLLTMASPLPASTILTLQQTAANKLNIWINGGTALQYSVTHIAGLSKFVLGPAAGFNISKAILYNVSIALDVNNVVLSGLAAGYNVTTTPAADYVSP